MQKHLLRLSLFVLAGVALPMVALSATISGTVTGPDATLLPGIYATAYTLNGSSWDWMGQAQTDGDGNYTIDWLQAGTYRVQFDDWQNYEYFSGVYSNAPNLDVGTDIVVLAETTAAGINATLARICTISGTVTGTNGVTALQGIWANAFKWNGSSWDNVNAVPTDEYGNYKVGSLPAGTYRVWFDAIFNSDYLSQWYDDAPDLESGTNIVVTGETTGINASLRLASKIRGTVTGPGGTPPLAGIYVDAYTWNGSTWAYTRSGCTDGEGDYTIGGLPAGTNRVQFYDGNGDYLSEWYDDAPTLELGTNIFVLAAEITGGINASLALASKITGTVTGPTGTPPLPGISANAYTWKGGYWGWVQGTQTDIYGNYTIGGLPAGTYRVQFDDGQNGEYRSQAYDNAKDVYSGTNIVVPAAETVHGINASLANMREISGTVTGTGGTTLLPGIRVTAYAWNGLAWDVAGADDTDANGRYAIGVLPAGTYRVRFDDWQNGEYVAEWYYDAQDLTSAADIGVPGETTQIDASLATASKISGTVTGPDELTLLPGIWATAYAWNGSAWAEMGQTQTDVYGNYTIGGLGTGTYRVQFDDRQNRNFLTECYFNATDLYNGTDIEVPTEETVHGINASLAAWPPEISGTVTGPDGTTPLPDIYAAAYTLNGSSWDWVGWAQTDAYGNYTIGGLSAGTYRVQFSDWTYYEYFSEVYDNASDLDSGTNIVVSGGTTGINASLGRICTISGTVTKLDGFTPLSGIMVHVYAWDEAAASWYVKEYRWTDVDGRYSIGGLPAGTNRVWFADWSGEYFSEVYDNAFDLESGTNIVLTGGVTEVNALLTAASKITGTVTGPNGTPLLSVIYAYAYTWNGSYWAWASGTQTDANGYYAIGSLTAGTYRVGFYDWSGRNYLPQAYDNAITVDDGTNIVVAAETTVTNINASLAVASKIAGTVTGPNGTTLLPGIRIYAYSAEGSSWNSVGWAQSDAGGHYTLGGLTAGTYRVQFSDPSGNYLTEAYDNVSNLDLGTNIVVMAAETVSGIDASLANMREISGTVTGPGRITRLPGIQVTAYTLNGSSWDLVGADDTDANGRYTIGVLPAGTYRVQFDDLQNGDYSTECYNDATDLDSAADIVVPGETTGIDASLARARPDPGTLLLLF
ncbi:MAG: hypothetical protein WCK89_04410 [bacterium]